MKSYNQEPRQRGKKILSNAKSGLKNSIRVALQPRRGSKRALGLMVIIAGYSWHHLHNDNNSIDQSLLSGSSENRLILAKETAGSLVNSNNALTRDENSDASIETNERHQDNNLITESIAPETVEKERIFHTIKRGESLGSIMSTYNFPANLPYKIVKSEQGKLFKKIRAGVQIEFVLNKDTHELEEIHYPHSKLSQLVANVKGDITVALEDIEYDIIHATASGNINYSLFGAATQSGISENMIMEMSEIFGWDVDFVRDIRKGDSFKLIFEKYINEGNIIQEGNIVAAEFINKGKKFTAVRHIDNDGNIGYFAPDGSSMKGTFLKSPMRFSRISSGFSGRRFHPVLKKWRAHKGVDYAARTGTPIRSVANGKVIHRGTKGGYGRTMVLSHGGKYTTLYAHMNKYSKLRTGQHVKQGQVIGYVGSSGLATGPHLHYEFRVNGVHRNPLTYKTPKASAISKKERPQFEQILEKQLIALSEIPSNNDKSNIVANTDSLNSNRSINASNNPSNISTINTIESALQ